MRIEVFHDTVYTYATPARAVTQILRLTPRAHDGQFIAKWRLDIDVDGRLHREEDGFGNIVHRLSVDGPIGRLAVQVRGVVETTDTNGVIRGGTEPVPEGVYLRDTDLTRPDEAILRFSRDVTAGATQPLEVAHRLLVAIHREVVFDVVPTHSATTAAESFAMRRGVCQDLTHIFLACARSLGMPARYVSGYFKRVDGVVDQDAGHAWAEAMIEGLGWVGFDPANGISPSDAHVRVAVGLDYLGAAPVRGSRFGGGGEELSVSLTVDQSARQSQS